MSVSVSKSMSMLQENGQTVWDTERTQTDRRTDSLGHREDTDRTQRGHREDTDRQRVRVHVCRHVWDVLYALGRHTHADVLWNFSSI